MEDATHKEQSLQIPSPEISLPKGGGAIKGIDEKFSVNPAAGTAALSVPIVTSPGRQGFSPQLSLKYNSGAGNGPFGFGWQLSVPSITRKTDKGIPKYRDAEESDTVILSGAEDLVPVLVRDGENWEEEVVPDRMIGEKTYAVRRYRPRIEGLFARIERWRRVDTGDVYWRSVTKENVTSFYGRSSNSRIADPEDATGRRVFSWLLEETHDDKGNVIFYEYKPEDSAGVDLGQSHERNRSDATRSAQHYLKRIWYGNRTPHQPNEALSARTDWMFEVLFDYDEGHYRLLTAAGEEPVLVQVHPSHSGDWPVREDPFSSYRSGFEVRSYRLCRRVLMFHHFPEELDRDAYLVRSTEFEYDEGPVASFITHVRQSGYVHREGNAYLKKSLPPLEFSYTKTKINRSVRSIEPESLENLPAGLKGPRYRWVDLDGEGISGVLTEHSEGWLYKRNLGAFDFRGIDRHPPEPPAVPNPAKEPGLRFAPARQVATRPSAARLQSSRQQIMDLAGDGQKDLVLLGGASTGFFEREDGSWATFIPFKSVPQVPWGDANLRMIDLNGDGHADILISENETFVWHPSESEEGFGAFEFVRKVDDEEKGPTLVFADPAQSVYLTDMSGDGLSDIARIRNGEICYWPNLGYGRFGAKVTMDNAPHFDVPDLFNQSRVRLADIDGSGTTDVIYLGRNEITLWFNQAGNRWPEEPERIGSFPFIDNLSDVQVIDLLGNGTACLVWSSPLPSDAGQSMRYIDLMGGKKPHLLHKVTNNLGAERTVTYAPSTRFYLRDMQAGKPWVTKLPFPVHAVERLESVDHISRTHYISHYRYHHGYFDGVEREFRGFGMVEQWDTDIFAEYSRNAPAADSPHGSEEEHHLPPVYTKTWFHTGAYLEGQRISRHFEDEYYDGDPSATLLPDTVIPDEDFTVDEIREATRALKGRMLRREVYAVDGGEKAQHPYTVSEQNFGLKRLQPRQDDRHAVFSAHNREAVSHHYERNPSDPRVLHAFTLAVDHYGNVTRSAKVGYPRHESAAATIAEEQQRTYVAYTEADFINQDEMEEFYLVGVPHQRSRYEVTGRSAPSDRLFRFDEIDSLTADAESIPYEAAPDPAMEQKRLLRRTRTRYYSEDLRTPLGWGEITAPLLRYESYQAAFTPELLTKIFGEKMSEGELTTLLQGREGGQGGYVFAGGFWWISSGRRNFVPPEEEMPGGMESAAFARQNFFLPVSHRDPFGNTTHIQRDGHKLLLIEMEDPAGNTVSAANNYRTLQPWQITDPNGNRSQVAFDALGMVAATAVRGKEGQEDGDRLEDFKPNPDRETIRTYLDSDDLTVNAHKLLGRATTRLIYDLWRYHDTKAAHQPQPAVVWTLAREQHDSDLAAGETPPIQHSLLYSDGLGRELLTKARAEPGPLQVWDFENEAWRKEWGGAEGESLDPRWVGTGRTVFNNKGKPIKKYEPFFSATHRYQDEAEVVMQGVTPVLRYDPLGRRIRTDNPDGTFSKVEFDPWQQTAWDENDTVLDSQWYAERGSPDPFTTSPPSDPEEQAAYQAAEHAQTPAVQHFDPLGRPFLSLAHNKEVRRADFLGEIREIREHKIPTRTELDIEGNPLAIKDGRRIEEAVDPDLLAYEGGNTVMEYRLRRDGPGSEVMAPGYDMTGRRLYQRSMDAGERRTLPDVGGNPLRTWDSHGQRRRYRYDQLRRQTHLFVQFDDGNEILAERIVHGENHAEATERNLNGGIYQQYDGAGVVTNAEFDFKGNRLRSNRRLALEYQQSPDWSPLAELTDIEAIQAAADSLLEPETFTSQTRYDALGRPIQSLTPYNDQVLPNVIQPAYNEAGLPERVDVWLRRGAGPAGLLDPDTADMHAVTRIDYDAKGQRTRIEYGNEVTTTYEYDPRTFRLIHLYTRRGSEFSEDCGSEPPPPRAPGPEEPPEGEPCGVQNLSYTYDPVGNITGIRDDAQQRIFYRNAQVKPEARYAYDALYRLIRAAGREHIGLSGQPDHSEVPPQPLPHPNDTPAMRRYTEKYLYDVVGNILQMEHRADRGDWNRRYEYAGDSNRLLGTSLPGDEEGEFSAGYTYNNHGSMTGMPHLAVIKWDFKEQMQQADLGGGGTVYFTYDASGQRVRKVHAHNGSTVAERIYLSGFEIYRRRNTGGLQLERETLHVMDDQRRIALVETKTREDGDGIDEPSPVFRYQLNNHLGSSCVELDEDGIAISCEEYHPYGTTSVHLMRSRPGLSLKRYRYTGKERDEESGLYYCTARYCTPCLGRWLSVDPAGLENTIRAKPIADRESRQHPKNCATGRMPKINCISNASPDSDVAQNKASNKEKRDAVDSTSRPQDVNFYNYANDNPQRYIDPDGRGAVAVIVVAGVIVVAWALNPTTAAESSVELSEEERTTEEEGLLGMSADIAIDLVGGAKKAWVLGEKLFTEGAPVAGREISGAEGEAAAEAATAVFHIGKGVKDLLKKLVKKKKGSEPFKNFSEVIRELAGEEGIEIISVKGDEAEAFVEALISLGKTKHSVIKNLKEMVEAVKKSDESDDETMVNASEEASKTEPVPGSLSGSSTGTPIENPETVPNYLWELWRPQETTPEN